MKHAPVFVNELDGSRRDNRTVEEKRGDFNLTERHVAHPILAVALFVDGRNSLRQLGLRCHPGTFAVGEASSDGDELAGVGGAKRAERGGSCRRRFPAGVFAISRNLPCHERADVRGRKRATGIAVGSCETKRRNGTYGG